MRKRYTLFLLMKTIKIRKMNRKNETIGKLIQLEVCRQQISVQAFAEMICCTRTNVYNIFSRNSIDISLLQKICKVLNRNFFKEIAEDMNLANEVNETEEERENRIALSNFHEYVPDCLKKMGKSTIIIYGEKEFDVPVPEYLLYSANISFTKGVTYREKLSEKYNDKIIHIDTIAEQGVEFEVITNRLKGLKSINIKIDIKSYEEWYKTLKLAFDYINRK